MPRSLGPWSTIHQRFQGLRDRGTFDQIFKRVAADAILTRPEDFD
ncbi:hypothetical protein [Pseudomonas simiae]